MAVETFVLPVVNRVEFTDKEVVFVLSTRGKLIFSLNEFPRLAKATQEQRNNWRLRNGGHSIRWDDIDEDVSIPLLLTGKCI